MARGLIDLCCYGSASQLLLSKPYHTFLRSYGRNLQYTPKMPDLNARHDFDAGECLWQQQLEGETGGELEGRTDGNEAGRCLMNCGSLVLTVGFCGVGLDRKSVV